MIQIACDWCGATLEESVRLETTDIVKNLKQFKTYEVQIRVRAFGSDNCHLCAGCFSEIVDRVTRRYDEQKKVARPKVQQISLKG